ncbi:MAG: hypothetical protein DHS20C01_14360 [marine bacterium B5-7]|nr:MAG: hypothetical protein DHS20C01_14360 [marine bacterium B5-7]
MIIPNTNELSLGLIAQPILFLTDMSNKFDDVFAYHLQAHIMNFKRNVLTAERNMAGKPDIESSTTEAVR